MSEESWAAWQREVARKNIEMLGPEGDHEHEWGAIDHAVFTGNPHRKCQVEGCQWITLDLSDEEE